MRKLLLLLAVSLLMGCGSGAKVIICVEGDEPHPRIWEFDTVNNLYTVQRCDIEDNKINTCNECHNPPVERCVNFFSDFYRIEFGEPEDE